MKTTLFCSTVGLKQGSSNRDDFGTSLYNYTVAQERKDRGGSAKGMKINKYWNRKTSKKHLGMQTAKAFTRVVLVNIVYNSNDPKKRYSIYRRCFFYLVCAYKMNICV